MTLTKRSCCTTPRILLGTRMTKRLRCPIPIDTQMKTMLLMRMVMPVASRCRRDTPHADMSEANGSASQSSTSRCLGCARHDKTGSRGRPVCLPTKRARRRVRPYKAVILNVAKNLCCKRYQPNPDISSIFHIQVYSTYPIF